ncbi:MAG: CYTH domain-containing protein [Myxococcota bacterium]|nr:CYTH domain-containing protein [Myxococcota bacterium]
MPIEIEYKFLVHTSLWLASKDRENATVYTIEQGYISTNPEAVVRVRLKNQNAYITIKGKAKGAVRPEFEYGIPYSEAQELLSLCKKRIRKKRFVFSFEGRQWEVDEFEGENQPLILAEIEVPSLETSFQTPSWIGEDVTSDHRYSNSSLSQEPYQQWNSYPS